MDEIGAYIDEKLKKEQKLLDKCYQALRLYSSYCDRYGKTIDYDVKFGKPIYEARKKLLEKDKNLKLGLQKRINNCTLADIDFIVNVLKENEVLNNEKFADDLITLLNQYDKQTVYNRIGSDIVIEVFLNYVLDQKNLSAFNVDFFTRLQKRYEELTCEKDDNDASKE